MSLIVQKFGGTSVADSNKIKNVAEIILKTKKQGHDVVAVVSAQGDLTDELINKAKNINCNPPKRELASLVSVGEQISASLVAMAIEKLNQPAISLTGWQAGLKTELSHCNSKVVSVNVARIKKELSDGKIVVVTGFQGFNNLNDITTIGRGGSDTTAAILAIALNASSCQIFTDVSGVYSVDPNLNKNAVKLKTISCDEMLELASSGVAVLHNRSVELAKKHNLNLEVLSSFEPNLDGTKIKDSKNIVQINETAISGIANETSLSCLKLINNQNLSKCFSEIFSLCSKHEINLKLIAQTKNDDGMNNLSLIIPENQLNVASKMIEQNLNSIGASKFEILTNISKISIIGSGINSKIINSVFNELTSNNIIPHLISTSGINISILIDKKNEKLALELIHKLLIEN